jgi:KTSC domain
MDRTPVQSSALKSFGVEGDVIEIELHSGTYRYSGVLPEHIDAFVAAPSKGRALAELKKHYAGVKVVAEPAVNA